MLILSNVSADSQLSSSELLLSRSELMLPGMPGCDHLSLSPLSASQPVANQIRVTAQILGIWIRLTAPIAVRWSSYLQLRQLIFVIQSGILRQVKLVLKATGYKFLILQKTLMSQVPQVNE